jgi:iron(III) transport system substrate-binding protein
MNRSVQLLGLLLMSVLPVLSIGCDNRASNNSASQTTDTITLYTSVDDTFAELVIDAFIQETGIQVHILGDTEATKTTGLVTRIQAEMENPIGDVWWSSEPMGTILLDKAGALEPGSMEGMVPDDWPEALHSQNWSWVGMAMRARVIAYAPDRIENPPTTLAQLTDPRFKGTVGMARPQFGTTRIHMAMLADSWGMDSFTDWLEAMRTNKLRLYDGNSRVVQAISMGEIDIGLTDTDDVWSGQRNGWKVDLVYETTDQTNPWPSSGPTLIPNTVAVIKGAANVQGAKLLAAYLVSPEVEELLYLSTTHNTPVHPHLRETYKDDVLSLEELPDYTRSAEKVREAIDACEQVLISP